MIDEAVGRAEARRRNLRVTGTLGVLRAAAELGLVDVPGLIVRIEAASFYADDALLTAVFGRWLTSSRTTLIELPLTLDSACPTVLRVPNSSSGGQSLRDRRPGDVGAVLEHERRSGIAPEHFHHQLRPSSAQGLA